VARSTQVPFRFAPIIARAKASETLFGSLKVERLHGEKFATIRHAMDETIAWILWYNRTRMHSSLNYLSPMDYEQNWNEAQGRGNAGLMERVGKTNMPFFPLLPQPLEIASSDSHIPAATTTTGF
jgi:hypothetical protein